MLNLHIFSYFKSQGQTQQKGSGEYSTPEATFDEPPPQDHNTDEQPEVDTAVPDDEPGNTIRADDRPSSPEKATDTPSTPEKTAGDKEGEDIITSTTKKDTSMTF